jgi:hypothetical protein
MTWRCKRSRSAMLIEFGDTYSTLGDLEQTLKAYREGLAIQERLSAADPSNLQWQNDLGITHERVGNVLMAEGDPPYAYGSYGYPA